MIVDSLMFLSSVVCAVLFVFLGVMTSIMIGGLFVRKKYAVFEPSISVVIPAYNEEKNIKECLMAIDASRYPKNKVEVIVVDDGSTDATAKIARGFRGVHVIKGCHNGKTAALNLGVKYAKHDFVVTIDADTLLEKECLKKIVVPLQEHYVGAVAGATCVKNARSVWGAFQNIEYYYNNIVRKSFSSVFKHTVWFHGAIACYRASALKQAGYFKQDTLAEDLDMSLELYKQGYATVQANAHAYTVVPNSLRAFMNQRVRWCTGVFQSMRKHRDVLKKTASPSIWFVFINQWWWALFALVSFPMFFMQIMYWLPYNTTTVDLGMYFLRWFSALGPAYVLYKVPVWGVNTYNFFGVMSGVMTTITMMIAIKVFKDKLFVRNAAALFFYFPYTLVLNAVTIMGVMRYKFYKPSFFIR